MVGEAWSLAGHADEAAPDGMKRPSTTARWDHDAARYDVRSYAAAVPGDPGGVLTGDDTGFEKKDSSLAGVQRQYSGTAGKIISCQPGVSLGSHLGSHHRPTPGQIEQAEAFDSPD